MIRWRPPDTALIKSAMGGFDDLVRVLLYAVVLILAHGWVASAR